MDHSVLLAVYLKAFEKKIDRCLTGPIMRTDVDEAETLGTCTVCLCPLLAVRIPPIGQLNNLTLLYIYHHFPFPRYSRSRYAFATSPGRGRMSAPMEIDGSPS